MACHGGCLLSGGERSQIVRWSQEAKEKVREKFKERWKDPGNKTSWAGSLMRTLDFAQKERKNYTRPKGRSRISQAEFALVTVSAKRGQGKRFRALGKGRWLSLFWLTYFCHSPGHFSFWKSCCLSMASQCTAMHRYCWINKCLVSVYLPEMPMLP